MLGWVLNWGLEACFTVFHSELASALSTTVVWSLWGSPGRSKKFGLHPAIQSPFELGTLVKGIGIASLIRAYRSSIGLHQLQAKQNIFRFYLIESWFRSESKASSIMFSFIAEFFFMKYFSKEITNWLLDIAKNFSISENEKSNREYDCSYLCMYVSV